MRSASYCYVDFAKGDVRARNNVVRIHDAIRDSRESGKHNSYITVYRFPPQYLDHCRQFGSVSGYAGACMADFLPIDIDRENELGKAWAAAIAVAIVLQQQFEVGTDQVRYFFSGAKGYHLLIPTALMGNVEPSPLLPAIFRGMAEGLADMAGEKIDGKIYDINRLFRLPDTQHAVSGLWKIELTWEEFSTLHPAEHQKLAAQPRYMKWQPHDLEENDALAEYFAKHAADAGTPKPRTALARGGDKAIAHTLALILQNGYTKGHRHALVLAFAGYAAKKNLPRETALGVIEDLAAGDDELSDRLRAVEDTYDKVRTGQDVRGYTELTELLGEGDLQDLRGLIDPRNTNGNGSQPQQKPEQAERSRISLDHVFDMQRAGAAYVSYARQLAERRVTIGIPTLDHQMRGLMPGTVTTLIAKARVGKSIFAQNVRRNIARTVRDGATLFFSLEMPIYLVWERDAQFAFNLAGRDVESTVRNSDEHGLERMIVEVARSLPRSYTVTQTGLSLEDMADYCRLLTSTFGHRISCVLIDYLSLVRGKGKDIYSVTSSVARGMKEFAKEIDAPVITLSQVRRRGGDGDKVDGSTSPTLEDARDSGAVEEGSDTVIGAWRPNLDEATDSSIGFKLLKNRVGIGGSEVICRVDWKKLQIVELQDQ